MRIIGHLSANSSEGRSVRGDTHAIVFGHFGLRILDFALKDTKVASVFNPKSAVQNPKLIQPAGI
jgi:hypothetical protein